MRFDVFMCLRYHLVRLRVGEYCCCYTRQLDRLRALAVSEASDILLKYLVVTKKKYVYVDVCDVCDLKLGSHLTNFCTIIVENGNHKNCLKHCGINIKYCKSLNMCFKVRIINTFHSERLCPLTESCVPIIIAICGF